jgi:hypothetical protein
MSPEGSFVFTSTSHLPLSSGTYVEPTLSHPTSLRYMLMLSSQLHLVLPSSVFPSGFPTKLPYTRHVPCPCYGGWSSKQYYVSSTDLIPPPVPDTCLNLPPGVSRLHHQTATQHSYYEVLPSGLWVAPTASTLISYAYQQNNPPQPEDPYWVSLFFSAEKNVIYDACSWQGCMTTVPYSH